MKNIKKFEDFEVNNENLYLPDAEGMPVLTDTSSPIKYPHNEYKIGEKVQVSVYADKHAEKCGIIGPPNKMKKDVDSVLIDFDDGSSDYVPMTSISRI